MAAQAHDGRPTRATQTAVLALALLVMLGSSACPAPRPAADARAARKPWSAAEARKPAAPAHAEPPSGPRALHYRIRIDAALSALEVEVCFDGSAPPELVSGVSATADALRRAWLVRGEQREPLAVAGTIPLRDVAEDACVGYELDVAALSGFRGGGPVATRRDEALLANVAAWLWRPRRWDRVPRADARFELPAGMDVAVPWLREGERYRLERSAFSFYGPAVFGRFERRELSLPVGTLTLAIMPGFPPSVSAQLAPWLTTAATAAAQVTGRLADERILAVVVPERESNEPVRFGMATRGGGSALLLLVPTNAELESLRKDWVAVHELCHLLHPFVARDQAWLSEGLATYYQEVLRVRAGLMSEQDAWRRIYEGSLRGRDTAGGLAQASAKVFESHDFPTVYWAGAAFALMADVELRRRSAGKRSLDDVMAGLASCCARRDRPQRAESVLARMDELAGTPVFSELAARWVHGPELPQLGPLYAQLGLHVEDGRVQNPGAEHAWIRAAIMSVRPAAESP
jgi:hypothetical protein